MHKTKEAAAAAGDMKYFNGRPCRRGHDSPRYTSSGNCISCVELITNKNKIKNKASRRIRNAKAFGDNTLFAASFPVDLHPLLNRLHTIFQGSDSDLQQRIIAVISDAPAVWNRDAFLAAGVLFNGQYITNAAQFPIGTPFSIKIGGIWWPGVELMVVLRGEAATVAPCDFTPTEG